MTSSDPTYTQLPDDLPDRIRSLALDVTASHPTPYEKTKALEHYLRTQYAYRYASTADEGLPPPGRDPVDWFLFDSREGTCGTFSTAFAVMARSIGIPARVVTGWVVAPTADPQVVESSQAHQWAEVPFEGIGWVRFEPTASGGAPSRLAETYPGIDQIAQRRMRNRRLRRARPEEPASRSPLLTRMARVRPSPWTHRQRRLLRHASKPSRPSPSGPLRYTARPPSAWAAR